SSDLIFWSKAAMILFPSTEIILTGSPFFLPVMESETNFHSSKLYFHPIKESGTKPYKPLTFITNPPLFKYKKFAITVTLLSFIKLIPSKRLSKYSLLSSSTGSYLLSSLNKFVNFSNIILLFILCINNYGNRSIVNQTDFHIGTKLSCLNFLSY